jgi:hypothetical protein
MKSGRGFLELRKIEAAKEIAQTLSQSPNITYLPSTGNMLMQLPSTSSSRAAGQSRVILEQQAVIQQQQQQQQQQQLSSRVPLGEVMSNE